MKQNRNAPSVASSVAPSLAPSVASIAAASLEDRIEMIRAEIERVVQDRVDTIARESPGVPKGVIRNLLIARAPSCACEQYLTLRQQARGDRRG
jgi:hypothetical protein